MKDNLRSLITAWRSQATPPKPVPPDYTSRVYVLARFVQDEPYKKIQQIARETASHGGTPVEVPHLTLAYFGDVTDVNVLLPLVEKELRKLPPFKVALQGLELMPHNSLWLQVSKTPRLHTLTDRLADIVLWCGFSHRGFPPRNWVPHILLAKFPPDGQLQADALPWDIADCKELCVNELLITHQLGESEFETLARIPLSLKKPVKSARSSSKKKTSHSKSARPTKRAKKK